MEDLIVIKVDETDSWCDDIQEKAGKLFGYYLIDSNHYHYLCEMTPSYHARFLYTMTENYVSEDFQEEVVMGAIAVQDPDRYYHATTKFHVVDKWEVGDEIDKYQEDYEEYMEYVWDCYRGNPVE